MEGERYATFNTGLVDRLYDPIFALFEKNRYDQPPWQLMGFCVPGHGLGKILTEEFPDRPQRAQYFEQITDAVYTDPRMKPDADWEHIVLDGIREGRLPPKFLDDYRPDAFHEPKPETLDTPSRVEWLSNWLSKSTGEEGFSGPFLDFLKDMALAGIVQASADDLQDSERQAWLEKATEVVKQLEPEKLGKAVLRGYLDLFASAVDRDTKALRRMTTELNAAMDRALKRVEWNYKTAIPMWYPTTNKMTWLLPLAIMHEDKVDNALVVERARSGNYLAHTVLPLHLAYMNARLVCRPDSDWLAPNYIRLTQGIEY